LYDHMKKRLVIWLILAFLPSWAAADVIVLKNGNRIETQGAWEENGVIKYFKDGAIAEGIPRKNIRTIETDSEEDAIDRFEPEQALSDVDLQKQLLENAPPRNPIEQAANATVTIKATIGSGSGFFITANGYILTNSHVIKGDKKKLEDAEKKLQSAKEHLKRADKMLKAEHRRIKNMEEKIKSDRSYNNSHNQSVLKDARQRYQANYKIYKKQKTSLKEKNKERRHLKARLLVQKTVKIILIDQTELNATIEKFSPRRDLALLKLTGHKTPFIRPGRVLDVARSDTLYAIGNPLNFSHSVSAGVFSGHQRGMLMTSAPINAGNSGGPLVTEDGRVVGITTMKMVGEGVEGIGFAIPIHTAFKEFKEILEPHMK